MDKQSDITSIEVLLVIPLNVNDGEEVQVMGNKVVKSVSFNITNEDDQRYLDRVQNINFSGYVKRLIEKDIRQKKFIPKVSSLPSRQ